MRLYCGCEKYTQYCYLRVDAQRRTAIARDIPVAHSPLMLTHIDFAEADLHIYKRMRMYTHTHKQ